MDTAEHLVSEWYGVLITMCGSLCTYEQFYDWATTAPEHTPELAVEVENDSDDSDSAGMEDELFTELIQDVINEFSKSSLPRGILALNLGVPAAEASLKQLMSKPVV